MRAKEIIRKGGLVSSPDGNSILKIIGAWLFIYIPSCLLEKIRKFLN